MRHSKSSWKNKNLEDYKRPLSKKGKSEIKLITKFLKNKKTRLDLAYVSSAKRTVQTYKKLIKKVKVNKIIFSKKLYLSYPERLDKWLRELNPKADQLAVLVVGDSPGAGTRRRALAIIDFDDFVQHYGKETTDEL